MSTLAAHIRSVLYDASHVERRRRSNSFTERLPRLACRSLQSVRRVEALAVELKPTTHNHWERAVSRRVCSVSRFMRGAHYGSNAIWVFGDHRCWQGSACAPAIERTIYSGGRGLSGCSHVQESRMRALRGYVDPSTDVSNSAKTLRAPMMKHARTAYCRQARPGNVKRFFGVMTCRT